MYARLDDYVTEARKHPPKRVAVAAAANALVLRSVRLAQEEGLIQPILVGPRAEIAQAAAEAEVDLDEMVVVGTETTPESAAVSVQLVREGKADVLMKGHLHTDDFLRAVLRSDVGLRTDRLLSHAFIMQIPMYHKLLLITDAAINIAPDLMQKAQILQNVIDMLVQLGIERPKAAVLSAIETINPKIPSTVDAACLHKMSERGQIRHALVDGPMAFDNAISREAAREKGIRSPVAGDVDILLVPDLDAGNILYKNLVYLANAQIAGVVMGAKAPIVLTSRADTVEARIHSLALASLLCAEGQAC
ncbi:MAG: bifunctional enoyl-CoA hydratase/phosphate acetyltransferase [Anaerolineae bacterium]|nr:bifunctional enoyl-CoA hydratase/phosphate acetyltransferase [Anaerolineae bacterium]